MATFFETLAERPTKLSRLARYTVWNGVFYMVVGAGLFVAPQSILELQFRVPLRGYESSLSNALGMTLLVIGFFYVMGARTGRASFGLATVVDRSFVPFLLGSLLLRNLVAPMMVVPFMILDPILALGAFLIWRKERA